MIRALLSVLVLSIASCGPSSQPNRASAEPAPKVVKGALTADQQETVKALVEQALMERPEILENVIRELERKRQAETDAQTAHLRPRIEGDRRDFVLGRTEAPVTIVEFFDYRCPYCHAAMDWALRTANANPERVRFVFKEYPVLGEASTEAAAAALAAKRQGKYLELHRAFMTHKGPLNSQQIDRLARQVGVNVVRMRSDMADPSLLRHLSDNHEVGELAQVNGTPSFMINGVWVRGWSETEAERLLQEALSNLH